MDLNLDLFSSREQGRSPLSGKPERGVQPPVREEKRQSAWTVSELTTQIKRVLEPSFSQVWVQGEISNCRPAGSGHVYFLLKDENATLPAAIFGWGARQKGRQTFALKDGLQVLCRGKLSIYPPQGKYQLIIDQVEPLGAGALQLAFEQLKARLASEGLFAAELKRRLPRFPTRIAVVTSPSGAAIQDMLNILRRRAPHLRVTVIPALVQGNEAASQIIRGIETANHLGLGDLIVLARGGGSIEDLWCFNDESLARAIRKSLIPVVSAVGHEIDFTISDFVADLRAPTPSAAAELVSGSWVEAAGRMNDLRGGLSRALFRELEGRKQLLAHLAARVVSPKDRLREQAQRIDDLSLRFERAFRVRLDRGQSALKQCMAQLDALSPLRVLERGYALVRAPGEEGKTQGGLVKSVKQVRPGQNLIIGFYDGQTKVQAI